MRISIRFEKASPDGKGFERHVRDDHNLWSYLAFLVHMSLKVQNLNSPATATIPPSFSSIFICSSLSGSLSCLESYHNPHFFLALEVTFSAPASTYDFYVCE
jgi:hypothetical protein